MIFLLSQLYIENIAVIQKADIRLREGFNVFTGETGAGKTILISAINAVLGARTSRSIIRSGESRAVVSALFSDLSPDAARQVEELGYTAEEGQLMIHRELDAGGSGSCRINGRPATTALLRQIASLLIDIHGQRDSQELLSTEKHLSFVDGFGGLEGDLEAYQRVYRSLCQVREKRESLEMDESYKLQRQDLLQYQLNEIESASLTPGEEEELLAQREMIRNSERITGALGSGYQLLTGGEDGIGIVSALGSLGEELDTASQFVSGLEEYQSKVEDLRYDLEELASTLRGSLEDYSFDPRQLDRIEDRLDLLYRLKKKYGATVEEIIAYGERSAQELDELTFADERAAQLREEEQALTAQAEKLAEALSAKRSRAGERFIASVREELAYLDMPNVRLSLNTTRRELGPTGWDSVEFFLAANPGEEPKPLSKTASGGELSRVMLAIKTVLAGKGGVGTLIFDEVDTGVSGRAAQKIGLKLAQVAKSRQVICVTHLAQVAAYAGHHSRIYKQVEKERTYTHVEVLDREERVRELARINAGENITDIAMESARELLTLAGN
ncbi:MAG: DNA repair protein RecN [Angelakisella sp.]|nr:DNA repair protein RecN [Angelakisella sp.]